jgi:hypothetical protein
MIVLWKKRRGRKIERSSPVGRAQNGLLGNPDPSPQDKGSNRRSPARRLEPSLVAQLTLPRSRSPYSLPPPLPVSCRPPSPPFPGERSGGDRDGLPQFRAARWRRPLRYSSPSIPQLLLLPSCTPLLRRLWAGVWLPGDPAYPVPRSTSDSRSAVRPRALPCSAAAAGARGRDGVSLLSGFWKFV